MQCLLRYQIELIRSRQHPTIGGDPLGKPIIGAQRIKACSQFIQTFKGEGPVQLAKFQMTNIQHIAQDKIIVSMLLKKIPMLAQQRSHLFERLS